MNTGDDNEAWFQWVLGVHHEEVEALLQGTSARPCLWLLRNGRVELRRPLSSPDHRAEVLEWLAKCPADLAVLSDDAWRADETQPEGRREALITDAVGRDLQTTIVTEIERPGWEIEFGPTEVIDGAVGDELGPLWSVLGTRFDELPLVS